MVGVSVHKLDKESFVVPRLRTLRDDAILAFSAFAGV